MSHEHHVQRIAAVFDARIEARVGSLTDEVSAPGVGATHEAYKAVSGAKVEATTGNQRSVPGDLMAIDDLEIAIEDDEIEIEIDDGDTQ